MNIMIGCKCGCSRGYPELREIPDLKAKMLDEYECSNCHSKFKYEEGFIKFLTECFSFSLYSAISDATVRGQINVIIGQMTTINFQEPVRRIEKVVLTGVEGFGAEAYYGSEDHTESVDKFTVYTSDTLGENSKIGEKGRLNFCAYVSLHNPKPIWLQFLIQAQKSIMTRDYALSIVSSEICVESFLNLVLRSYMIDNGVSNIEMDKKIKDTPIYPKMHKLLKKYAHVEVKKTTQNSDWMQLVEARNKIAHGKKINFTYTDSKKYLEYAIRIIFYINRKCSKDFIYS